MSDIEIHGVCPSHKGGPVSQKVGGTPKDAGHAKNIANKMVPEWTKAHKDCAQEDSSKSEKPHISISGGGADEKVYG